VVRLSILLAMMTRTTTRMMRMTTTRMTAPAADQSPPTGITNNNAGALGMENGVTRGDYNEEAV